MDSKSAIDQLYLAFANTPKPMTVTGCFQCCISEEEVTTLLETPLRELSAGDLSGYSSSALLTVGEPDDYVYFLPRILDLSASDETWWPTIEVTGRAIRSAGFRDWSDVQRNAVADVFKAVISELIQQQEYALLDDWMCSAGRAGINVEPLLRVIENDTAAVLGYWERNAGKLDGGRLGNEFWELPNEQHDAIVKWFNRPDINLIYAKIYGYRTYK